MVADANLALLAPEIALAVTAMFIMLADSFVRGGLPRNVVLTLAVVGILISAGLSIPLLGLNTTAFGRALSVDDFAIFFKLLFLAATLLVILASTHLLDQFERFKAEFVGLLLLATTALMLMAAARELITIYIALEMSSLSIAFLSAWAKRDLRSTEAGLKYFLLSAMSSAVLLYGMALVYGVTGQTQLDEIARQLTQSPNAALFLAVAMLLAGFGFKVSAVPFQLWTPDVYEGAPTPVTAYLSVASKSAGFAAAIRVFETAFGNNLDDWQPLVIALAAATMTVGNVVALVQTNLKRMLAYSSIAQAGYVLVGVATASEAGTAAVLFYLLAYTATNLTVFIAFIAVNHVTGSERIADLRGLYRRSPWLAFAMAAGLLSLAGLPPFVGFFAKLFIFWTAIQAGPGLQILVLIGVINSAISLYYYAQVIHDMYMLPADSEEPVRAGIPQAVSLAVAVAGVLALGVLSGSLLGIPEVAARTLAR
jgi:NADH-quinone oxidoreductase subunit N